MTKIVTDGTFRIGDRIRLKNVGQWYYKKNQDKKGTVVGFTRHLKEVKICWDGQKTPWVFSASVLEFLWVGWPGEGEAGVTG